MQTMQIDECSYRESIYILKQKEIILPSKGCRTRIAYLSTRSLFYGYK
jgi:hypothetical protein